MLIGYDCQYVENIRQENLAWFKVFLGEERLFIAQK
jgi:hypothetical protein